MHTNEKNKKTILWIITLILLNYIKYPVDNVVMKIIYQCPTSGNVRLYWISDNEEFTYEKSEEREIINSTAIFELSSPFEQLKLETVNEEGKVSMQNIRLYAAGFPYQTVKEKELQNYVTAGISDQIDSTELGRAFCKYVAQGISGTFNGINILWMIVATIIYTMLMIYEGKIKKNNDEETIRTSIFILGIAGIFCVGIYVWMYACRRDGVSDYPNWYLLACCTMIVAGVLFTNRILHKKIVLCNVLFSEVFKILEAGIDVLIIETATGNLLKVTGIRLLRNVFLVYVLIGTVELIVSKSEVVMHIMNLCCLIFGMTCYYVMQFRGTPFVPWDLKVVATAAQTYNFKFEVSTLCALLICICNILLINMVVIQNKRNRYVWLARYVVISVFVTEIVRFEAPIAKLWDLASTYRDNGSLTSYLSNIQYMFYKVPKGYSEKKSKNDFG